MRLLKLASPCHFKRYAGDQAGPYSHPWIEFWRRFRRQPVAMVAGLFVLLLILVAIIAPG